MGLRVLMCVNHKKIILFIAVTFIVLSQDILAQNYPSLSIQAVFTNEPPVIDGKGDETCWENAPVLTNFISHRTKQPMDALYQTRVRLLYDQSHLFALVECMDPDPNSLQAISRKYDRRMGDEDHIELQLDPLHSKRSGYEFLVNPLGTRRDLTRNNFTVTSTWDADWSASCSVQENRWIAEIAIPIACMNFIAKDNITWGINIHRGYRGRQERSSWSYFTVDTFDVRRFGELQGLNLAETKVPLSSQFEIYGSTTIETDSKSNKQATGVDMSLQLGPQFNVTTTVNPDFGQVEADVDTIELRDTERFLPEERPFFQEGAEIFRTPINIYFSRRIADIDAGAKGTAAGKDWSFGFVNIKGEINRDNILGDPNEGRVLNPGNFTVLRYTKTLSDDLQLGAMLVNSQRDNGYNRTAGIDWFQQLNEHTEWKTQLIALLDREELSSDQIALMNPEDLGARSKTRREYAIESELKFNYHPVSFGTTLRDISENFEPDLGFVRRNNIRGARNFFRLRDDIKHDIIERYDFRTEFTYYDDNDNKTSLRDFRQRFQLNFTNKWDVRLRRNDDYHRPFKNDLTEFWLGYDRDDKWHSVAASFTFGEFEESSYESYMLNKPFKLNDRLTMEFNGVYRNQDPVDGVGTVWLARWVTECFLPGNARLKLTYENTNQGRHNYGALLEWLPNKNWEVYLVYTDLENDEDAIDDKTIFAKITRRF